jgi:hypothetical protein
MATTNTGGPAFPLGPYEIDQGLETMPQHGMSLRDWFAGQMLPRIGMGWPNEENRALLAKQAYQMADAMIAARDATS